MNEPNTQPFEGFPKIARLSRDIVVSEKLDGTNAQIYIEREEMLPLVGYPFAKAIANKDGLIMYAGSRNRWITTEEDNAGFARWVSMNSDALFALGEGKHFGEWWGAGIQRRYGLNEKRFSLFNAARWGFLNEVTPEQNILASVCSVVPVLYTGPFDTAAIEMCIDRLRDQGSVAAPGFMDPEGIVIYHTASGHLYKKTIKNDESPKGLVQ